MMRMVIPRYSFWVKSKTYEVTEKIKLLGCKILKENEKTLEIEVPDSWYFTTDNQKYLIAFSDKNRTNAILEIKERINTGVLETHILI